MTILVHKYGLLDPINWDQDCQEILFRMNRFWNQLVEIEHQNRERYRQIVGQDQAVAPIEAELVKLKAERSDLIQARKENRAKKRTKQLDAPEVDARIKEIAPLIRDLALRARVARKDARESMKAPLEALELDRREAVKTAKRKSGLWWGNSEAIQASYEVARVRAMKANGELRFRSFDGTGRFSVRLTGGGISPELLFGGSRQAWLDLTEQPVPGRKPGTLRPGRHRPRLSVTLYTNHTQEDERGREARMLSFPMIYDRPLPSVKDEAGQERVRVTQVVVTRTRVATKWRYSVSITCHIPDPVSITNVNPAVCAVNLGFRMRQDRSLLVATMWDGKAARRAELPADWVDGMDRVETLQQRRDVALNAVAEALRAGWTDRPDGGPEELSQRLGDLVKAPKFGSRKLAGLVLHWRQAAPDWWPQMYQRLEDWRRLDKKDYEAQENAREHLHAARKVRYQLMARELAQRFGRIRLGVINLRQLAQRETPDGVESELHQAARRNRSRAALYSFKQELAQQCAKTATVIEEVDGAFTQTCHACGGVCAVTADVFHTCENCGVVWDQDENAGLNIFNAPSDERVA